MRNSEKWSMIIVLSVSLQTTKPLAMYTLHYSLLLQLTLSYLSVYTSSLQVPILSMLVLLLFRYHDHDHGHIHVSSSLFGVPKL
jgi:hypothetical protein